ncbi:hypothetical protein [Aquipseudomonas alcaligenes]|uniref:Uncharacterized protein n=1 Tax=Aquipseudomonas alcaligenes TaxID=43263 RepID=A0A1N6Q1I1_AQUAC|nr:hypothetical protein [Pseudomonas alcaligenes]SIQ10403.1 hypothetical protein SAMN05878282_102147 [Pseudomonas alcaligenes]
MSDDNAPAEGSSAPRDEGDPQGPELGKAAKVNRLLLYGLAGTLVLNLIAWILVFVLGGSSEPDEETLAALASKASVEALQKEVAALQLQIAPLQQQIKDQQRLIGLLSQQSQKPAQQPAAEGGGDSKAMAELQERSKENVRMLARTLIGQERNYQQSLAALKEGMRELAGMTAGSRSWLEFYEEALDKPMSDSQARVKALEKWSAQQNK